MWGHRYHVSEQGIVHTSDGPQAFVSLCCHPGKSDANGGDFALCLEVERMRKEEVLWRELHLQSRELLGAPESRGKGTAKHPPNDLRMRGQTPAWKTRTGCLGSWSHSGHQGRLMGRPQD